VTEFNNKIDILSNLYNSYRDDEDMADFFEYNDLGLPMANLVNEGLVAINEKGKIYIEETWGLFLESLEIEDMGFETLDQVLGYAQNKQ
jgi:hypothetical protein